jgi:hypothetical protein
LRKDLIPATSGFKGYLEPYISSLRDKNLIQKCVILEDQLVIESCILCVGKFSILLIVPALNYKSEVSSALIIKPELFFRLLLSLNNS